MPSISIGGTVCSSSVQNFTLDNITPGRTATWAVTPSSLFLAANGTGTTASLQANNASAFGLATLIFVISAGGSGCGISTVSRQVWVGKPDISIEGDKELCTDDRGEAYVVYNGGADDITQGISTFSWTFNGPLATFTSHRDQAGYRAGGTAGYGTQTMNSCNKKQTPTIPSKCG